MARIHLTSQSQRLKPGTRCASTRTEYDVLMSDTSDVLAPHSGYWCARVRVVGHPGGADEGQLDRPPRRTALGPAARSAHGAGTSLRHSLEVTLHPGPQPATVRDHHDGRRGVAHAVLTDRPEHRSR